MRNETIQHKIQLVDHTVTTDRIIGRHFLHKYAGNVSYKIFSSIINVEDDQIAVLVYNKSFNKKHIELPPKYKTIMPTIPYEKVC